MKKKILIVDDSEETRIYVSSILKDYKVIEAINAIEAIKIINNEIIDLLITDYKMPKMDGFDLVTELKKIKKTFLL